MPIIIKVSDERLDAPAYGSCEVLATEYVMTDEDGEETRFWFSHYSGNGYLGYLDNTDEPMSLSEEEHYSALLRQHKPQ